MHSEAGRLSWSSRTFSVKGDNRTVTNSYCSTSEPEKQTATFDELFQEFYPKVVARGYQLTHNHYDAEDIAQRVFINLWRKWSDLTLGDRVAGLIYTMTTNESINTLRQRRRNCEDIADYEGTLYYEQKSSDAASRLEELFSILPPKEYMAVNLILVRELKYKDAAILAGVSDRTLRTHMHRARLRMREYAAGGVA